MFLDVRFYSNNVDRGVKRATQLQWFVVQLWHNNSAYLYFLNTRSAWKGTFDLLFLHFHFFSYNQGNTKMLCFDGKTFEVIFLLMLTL